MIHLMILFSHGTIFSLTTNQPEQYFDLFIQRSERNSLAEPFTFTLDKDKKQAPEEPVLDIAGIRLHIWYGRPAYLPLSDCLSLTRLAACRWTRRTTRNSGSGSMAKTITIIRKKEPLQSKAEQRTCYRRLTRAEVATRQQFQGVGRRWNQQLEVSCFVTCQIN